MINRRVHAIQSEGNAKKELNVALGNAVEAPQRLFHHSKKAKSLLLTKSQIIKLETIKEPIKCVIL